MDINGPDKLTIKKSGWHGRFIHLIITDVFRLLEIDRQKAVLNGYLAGPGRSEGVEMNDRERQGILMVQQIMKQLYPHIVSG